MMKRGKKTQVVKMLVGFYNQAEDLAVRHTLRSLDNVFAWSNHTQ